MNAALGDDVFSEDPTVKSRSPFDYFIDIFYVEVSLTTKLLHTGPLLLGLLLFFMLYKQTLGTGIAVEKIKSHDHETLCLGM